MSRILLTWELGLNLGHLARLLPVARQLREQGHTVLVAARDIQAAARVLGPAGIPFVQAPHLPQGIPLAHRPSGYADILLSQGWFDVPTLHGLTHAWLNLLRLFNPQWLVLDYSPTVNLAARIAQIPAVLVGNGFEIPPDTDPLPCFPGFSWATPAKAAASEAITVANANAVLSAFQAHPIGALRDLVVGHRHFLTTFPELDHYGERIGDARYIGPLPIDLKAPLVEWPKGEGPRIFASLRPDTHHVEHILGALATMDARVVCVAAGFQAGTLEQYRKDHIHYSPGPVDLQALKDADLCITYGAEGTLLWFLLQGVPQLISAWHVETFMAGSRIEARCLGRVLRDAQSARSVLELIQTMCSVADYRTAAQSLSQVHRGVPCADAATAITSAVGSTAEQPCCAGGTALPSERFGRHGESGEGSIHA